MTEKTHDQSVWGLIPIAGHVLYCPDDFCFKSSSLSTLPFAWFQSIYELYMQEY